MSEEYVSVFTQPGCLPCKRVIRLLEEANIEVHQFDITEDEGAYEFVKKLGAKSVPVVVGAGRTILGYEPTQLKDLILTLNNEQIHDYVYEGEQE